MSREGKIRQYVTIMAAQLRRSNPNHELLRLAEEPADPPHRERFRLELLERFAGGVTGSKEKVEMAALAALGAALGAAAGKEPEAVGIPPDVLEALKAESLRPETLKVEVERVTLVLDPPIDIFNVLISTSTGCWTFSAGSEHDLRLFLGGAQAAVSCLGGHLPMPEIPREASSKVYPEVAVR